MKPEAEHKVEALLEVMRRLRDPEQGCPWDVKQDFSSIAPYTIEEAYEVADAIERKDFDHLREELGDLLLQVVFHAQMADEVDLFDFGDVAEAITDKLIRRHPGVFSDQEIATAEAQLANWDRIKAEERRQKGEASALAGVPRGMAELQRSVKLQKRAGDVGFDWQTAEPVLDKFQEEIEELREAMHAADRAHIQDEMGDLLFAAVNLARQLDIDPAAALRQSNAKFERRFRAMERQAGGMESLATLSLEQMESLWQEIKHSPPEQGENG